MPLEHEPNRLTPEQRDRVLDLAAQLQAQHDEGTRVDGLVRAATEAGIEARFVHQALTAQAQASAELPRVLLVPFVLFVLQVCAFVYIQNPSVPGLRSLAPHEAQFSLLIAFALALWAALHRRVRWFVPLVPSIAWAAVGVPFAALHGGLGGAHPWLVPMTVGFCITQTVAAISACGLVAAIDGLGSLHLGQRRGGQL